MSATTAHNEQSRELYQFGDEQRIYVALRNMIRQFNEDLGGEVIDPTSVERFVLAAGRDHDVIMEREVGFIFE